MVDNSSSDKTQMESSLGGSVYPQGGAAGVKLEAVMEHLQRQQQARLEMERKERRLRDAHLMYAQQVAAQHAILAAARVSALGNSGKAQVHGVALDEVARGRDSGDDDDDVDAENDDEEEPVADDGSDEDEEDGPVSGLEFLRKQTLALQQSAMARQFTGYASGTAVARDDSSPVRVKEEPEDDLSPAGPQTATSPNGQADWGYDEHFKQNGSGVWGEESDSNRSRGEASRDFAKLYELDNDPNRKEFLDDLFTFMQKRGKELFIFGPFSPCSLCSRG